MDPTRFHEVYDRHIRGSRFFEEAAYYEQFRDRYLRTLDWVERVLPPTGGRVLDIGSGQLAVLCRHLLGAECDVLDIDTRSEAALRENGIGFVPLDLSRQTFSARQPYDLVIMAEVIEHVPTPPYVVLSNLAPAIRPGGHLLLTTPNLYRFRNLFRLATGRKIFDHFLVPGPDQPLGHFLEYSREQLEWHVARAGLQLVESSLQQLTWGGATRTAQLARRAMAPLLMLNPLWRDNLVILARNGAPAPGAAPVS
jgi:2-polyprenyl-3-methyl-5-hydroxy-6-metoxy-1,4-benzoquinol methylase